MNSLLDYEFFRQIEQIFNVDDQGLKDFAFSIFDSNNDGMISEMDLNDLIKATAQQKFYHKGQVLDLKRNDKIRALNDKIEDEDIYLKFFHHDYIKIIKEIKALSGNKFTEFDESKAT